VSARNAAIVGALLVAVFVVVVALGQGRDEGSGLETNALIERLAELAGDPASVPLDQIEAACRDEEDPTLLVVGIGLVPTCTVTIVRDERIGILRLEALEPVAIRAPAPEGDVVVRSEAAPGDDDSGRVTVAVGEGETAVVLRCLGAGACRVRIAP
jgi:hypothetical protein